MNFDRDVAPFVAAGWAVHWLHPRTKRPIGNEWSTAPAPTVESLRGTFSAGNNVGVRLGEPSATDFGYLHAFDIDIRIPELADEAWSALAALGIDRSILAEVQSGSGGESRHLYFVTDRAFDSRKLAVSDGKHRGPSGSWHYDWEIELFGTGKQVAMPPSIHPASGKPYIWVTPFDLDSFDQPAIAASLMESLGAAETGTYEFETRPPLDFKPGQLERDLDAIDISELDYDDWVRLGQALHHQFGGSQEGFDLWLHHTKRSSKFGMKQTPEQQEREMRRIKWRSFGKYRGKPVTMASVRMWAQEARAAALLDEFDDFDEDAEGGVDGSDFDAESRKNAGVSVGALGDDFEDLIDAPASTDVTQADIDDFDAAPIKEEPLPWQSLLDPSEDGRGWRPTLHNIELIVKNDPRLVGLPQLNEFTQETVQRTPPGVKAKKRKNAAKETRQLTGPVWQVRDTLNGENWTSARDYAIRSILEAPHTQGGYGMKITDRDLKAATVLAAWETSFHPVREYLDGLTWDGTPRIDTLFIDYLGVEDSSYARQVARLMMVAAVTRVFEPGHKWDYAVILEGAQGAGKSTFIRTLGRRWFSELEGNFHDGKEMVEKIQGSWIVEIPELSGFSRSDVQATKAFISRQTDKVRLAYEARAQDFPRQCILIGSTNDGEYLKDATGGRRFFPMACHVRSIDNAKLHLNIDQMWAEARHAYGQMRSALPISQGELPLYLQDASAADLAARLQESRRVESVDDATAGQIQAWLDKPINSGSIDDDADDDGQPRYREETCLIELWVHALGNDRKSYDQAKAQMLGRAMRLVPYWELSGGKTRFKDFGQQRFYTRFGDGARSMRMGLLKPE